MTVLEPTSCAAQFGAEEMQYEHIKVHSLVTSARSTSSERKQDTVWPVHVHRRPFTLARVSRGRVAIVAYNWRPSRVAKLRASLVSLRRWCLRRATALDAILHQKLGVFHVHGVSSTPPHLAVEAAAAKTASAPLVVPVPRRVSSGHDVGVILAANDGHTAAVGADTNSVAVVGGAGGAAGANVDVDSTTEHELETLADKAADAMARRDSEADTSTRASSPVGHVGATSHRTIDERPRFANVAAFSSLVRRSAPPPAWQADTDLDGDGAAHSGAIEKKGDADTTHNHDASDANSKLDSVVSSSNVAAGAMLAMRRAGSGANMVAAAMAARRRGMTLHDTVRRASSGNSPLPATTAGGGNSTAAGAGAATSSSAHDTDASQSQEVLATSGATTTLSADGHTSTVTSNTPQERGLAALSFETMLSCPELRGVPIAVC